MIQLVIDQPEATESLTFDWPVIIGQTTIAGLAKWAPGADWFCQFFNCHHLTTKRAIAARPLLRCRYDHRRMESLGNPT
jgi:hypothetical protein